MYVCMHVCMYACMYVGMHVCMHVCTHVCMLCTWCFKLCGHILNMYYYVSCFVKLFLSGYIFAVHL